MTKRTKKPAPSRSKTPVEKPVIAPEHLTWAEITGTAARVRTKAEEDDPVSNLAALIAGGNNSSNNSRTLFLHGAVSEETIQPIIAGIIDMNAESVVLPITLVISTLGGHLYEMFALYDTMAASAAPVHTVGLGKIMSAGCLLLAAGRKGSRSIGRNARLMYHPATGGTYGSIWQQQNELTEFKKEQRQLDAAIAQETGRPLTEVEALYKSHMNMDVYMSAKEALDFGFADQLVGARPAPPAPKTPSGAGASGPTPSAAPAKTQGPDRKDGEKK